MNYLSGLAFNLRCFNDNCIKLWCQTSGGPLKLEKKTLKHWTYTCTFVAFLNIHFFFFLSTSSVIINFYAKHIGVTTDSQRLIKRCQPDKHTSKNKRNGRNEMLEIQYPTLTLRAGKNKKYAKLIVSDPSTYRRYLNISKHRTRFADHM